MEAWTYERYGSADVLERVDVEAPTPADDEVLIRVRAAGLNSADRHVLHAEPRLVRLSTGLRRPRRRAILGSDVAGVVDAVGPATSRIRAGDEVYAEVDAGGLAELVAAPERFVAAKPSTLTFEDAAAVPMAAITALQAVRDHGRIREGQEVLVNGASGGVGTFVVQLAKAFGAQVTGVCSARNLDLVRSIGAHHVVDHAREDITRRDARFDLVIDIADTHPVRTYRRVMTPRGTFVFVGSVRDRYIRPILYGKLLSLVFCQRFTSFLARRNAEDLAFLAERIDAGDVRPIVERTYPMAEAPEAIRRLETGHVAGKLVVTVSG